MFKFFLASTLLLPTFASAHELDDIPHMHPHWLPAAIIFFAMVAIFFSIKRRRENM